LRTSGITMRYQCSYSGSRSTYRSRVLGKGDICHLNAENQGEQSGFWIESKFGDANRD